MVSIFHIKLSKHFKEERLSESNGQIFNSLGLILIWLIRFSLILALFFLWKNNLQSLSLDN